MGSSLRPLRKASLFFCLLAEEKLAALKPVRGWRELQMKLESTLFVLRDGLLHVELR